MNKKIRLLCDTNQMAYGSSSALLAILQYLPSQNTAFAWGVTDEILSSSELIHYTVKINNKDTELVKKNIQLGNFDAVLVISNLSNVNWYLDNNIPVFYVDLHHWYPSPKNHRVWTEASVCFVERFFEEYQLKNTSTVSVGPIITIKKPTKSEHQILVNIGGGENKWIIPGVNSNYIKIVYDILLDIKELFSDYKVIIAAGKKSIDLLRQFSLPKNFACGTFKQSDYLELLNKSEILFTSPGLNAVFEGMFYIKKVVFLPPQNASQIIQLKYYEKYNLVEKGLNFTEYFNHFKSLNLNVLDEKKLTYEVIEALKSIDFDERIKTEFSKHITKQFQQISTHRYENKINKAIKNLGEPGAKVIADNIYSKLNKTYTDTTVVIPTQGKRPDLLENAINKVFANTILPKEIIIVVDNNKFEFLNIKEKYAGRARVKIILNDKIRGVSATRNFGANCVKTKYISFLDDDDFWTENYLNEIFSDDKEFDICLVGFMKKKYEQLTNEKLPPISLNQNIFFVKNPGVRGSNITISKIIFNKIGGFNENLLSFNDMDFGIKISNLENIRYKSIQKQIVIFNSHNDKRISTAGSAENIQGLTEFLIIHGGVIPYLEEAKYRKRALKLWNIDPHSLEHLEKRFLRIKDNKDEFNAQFTNLLHASETLLFEKVYELDNTKNKIQDFIDKLCYQYEKHNSNRNFSLKIAFTTTNSKNAVQNLLNTTITELEKSNFNSNSETIVIEFLVIENSTNSEIIKFNTEFCRNLKNSKVKINYISWEEKANAKETEKPFQIARSRTFLINKINSLKWKASANQPIWILYDDFEFTATVPALNYLIENIRLGSVFHRLECIANENKLDAIVGGNSGSPPIPELSTVKLQLKDLKEIIQVDLQRFNQEKILKQIQQNPDYYYDLSRIDIDYFFVAQEIPKGKNKLDFIDDFLNKLLAGIPASRYLFANFNSNNEYNSAWYLCDDTAVSGGNTIYFNSDLLNSKTYWAIEYKNIKSRRADAIWFLLNKQKGFKIQKMNFPLTHARTKRISKAGDVTALINNSLKDILGVALWESIGENKYSELKNINKNLLHQKIEKRVEKFENNLKNVEQLLNEIAIIFPKATELISFNTLFNVSKKRTTIDYKQIKLIEYGS